MEMSHELERKGGAVVDALTAKIAYLSKQMPRVGTSDDARVSIVVNMSKGRDNRHLSPGHHPLDGPVLPACLNLIRSRIIQVPRGHCMARQSQTQQSPPRLYLCLFVRLSQT